MADVKKTAKSKNTDAAGRRVKKVGEPVHGRYADQEFTEMQEFYAEWLTEKTGYEVDVRSTVIASLLRSEFQKSPENQERMAKNAARREAEAEEREERRIARAEKKAEREAAKAEREAAPKPAKKTPAKKADPKAKAAPAKKTPTAKAKPAAKTPAKAAPRRRPAKPDAEDF